MRRGGWLLLIVLLGVVAGVTVVYNQRKVTLAKEVPPPPKPLERGTDGRASDWVWVKSDGDRSVVEVRARNFRQVKEPSVMELEGVELRLFHKQGAQYDLVRTDKAQFDIPGKSLAADGEVEITMGVHVEGPQHGRVLKIHTSGARFASDTGRAVTDRKATFEFDQGSGSATGAEYDPNSRELTLKADVVLDWRGKNPKAPPMHAEAGEAKYLERESKVLLYPWSKLTRDTLHMEAGVSVVLLEEGRVKSAEVQTARGVKDDPGRKVEFAADQLFLNFTEHMQIQHLSGHSHSEAPTRLVSTAKTARTTVTAEHVELDFAATAKDSTLASAVASGKSVAQADPITAPGAEPADTRVLRSDTIRMKMRPGGEEIDNVETAGAGTIDFVPNRTGRPKRSLKGDRMWIAYGTENRIQSFRSTNVSTRTEKPPPAGKPVPPPALTQSKELMATFDAKSSDLDRLEQKTDFRYEEGERRATSARATLEQAKDLMTLDGAARAWDPTGSATADHMVINQKTGDFTAEGHVASTRLPDKKGKSSAMLAADEILQARANKMISTDENKKIRYEGTPQTKAVAWQGANRIEADRLEIDRKKGIMEAHGQVSSQFADKPKAEDPQAPKKSRPPAPPVFTVVRAPDLVYTEETRVAVYTGGVALARPGLTVTGREITAYLKDSTSEDSSLDKAVAEGAVRIVSNTVTAKENRTRTGTSEHAEYYAGEDKVVLTGGQPLFVDSLKGRTTGRELTWWTNSDRLLVNGEEEKPAESTLIRKNKKK